MLATKHVVILLVTFLLKVQCQNECADYTVTVMQLDFLKALDVHLKCAYSGNPNYTTIGWQYQNDSGDIPTQAYTVYKNFPHFTGPSSGFEGRLEGNLDGKTHILTILKANSSDGLNFWRCLVNTAACADTNRDSLPLLFSGKRTVSYSKRLLIFTFQLVICTRRVRRKQFCVVICV